MDSNILRVWITEIENYRSVAVSRARASLNAVSTSQTRDVARGAQICDRDRFASLAPSSVRVPSFAERTIFLFSLTRRSVLGRSSESTVRERLETVIPSTIHVTIDAQIPFMA